MSHHSNVFPSGVPSDAPALPEYVPRHHVDTSHASASSGYTDTEALTYADLAPAPTVQSESEVIPVTNLGFSYRLPGKDSNVSLELSLSLSKVTTAPER